MEPGTRLPRTASTGFSRSSATSKWVIESTYSGLPLVARCTVRTTELLAGSPAICSTNIPTCDSVSPRNGSTRPSRASLVRIMSVPFEPRRRRGTCRPRAVGAGRDRERRSAASGASPGRRRAGRRARRPVRGRRHDSSSSVVTASKRANWTGGASLSSPTRSPRISSSTSGTIGTRRRSLMTSTSSPVRGPRRRRTARSTWVHGQYAGAPPSSQQRPQTTANRGRGPPR